MTLPPLGSSSARHLAGGVASSTTTGTLPTSRRLPSFDTTAPQRSLVQDAKAAIAPDEARPLRGRATVVLLPQPPRAFATPTDGRWPLRNGVHARPSPPTDPQAPAQPVAGTRQENPSAASARVDPVLGNPAADGGEALVAHLRGAAALSRPGQRKQRTQALGQFVRLASDPERPEDIASHVAAAIIILAPEWDRATLSETLLLLGAELGSQRTPPWRLRRAVHCLCLAGSFELVQTLLRWLQTGLDKTGQLARNARCIFHGIGYAAHLSPLQHCLLAAELAHRLGVHRAHGEKGERLAEHLMPTPEESKFATGSIDAMKSLNLGIALPLSPVTALWLDPERLPLRRQLALLDGYCRIPGVVTADFLQSELNLIDHAPIAGADDIAWRAESTLVLLRHAARFLSNEQLALIASWMDGDCLDPIEPDRTLPVAEGRRLSRLEACIRLVVDRVMAADAAVDREALLATVAALTGMRGGPAAHAIVARLRKQLPARAQTKK